MSETRSSRLGGQDAIRRQRRCGSCGQRYRTYEIVAASPRGKRGRADVIAVAGGAATARRLRDAARGLADLLDAVVVDLASPFGDAGTPSAGELIDPGAVSADGEAPTAGGGQGEEASET